MSVLLLLGVLPSPSITAAVLSPLLFPVNLLYNQTTGGNPDASDSFDNRTNSCLGGFAISTNFDPTIAMFRTFNPGNDSPGVVIEMTESSCVGGLAPRASHFVVQSSNSSGVNSSSVHGRSPPPVTSKFLDSGVLKNLDKNISGFSGCNGNSLLSNETSPRNVNDVVCSSFGCFLVPLSLSILLSDTSVTPASSVESAEAHAAVAGNEVGDFVLVEDLGLKNDSLLFCWLWMLLLLLLLWYWNAVSGVFGASRNANVTDVDDEETVTTKADTTRRRRMLCFLRRTMMVVDGEVFREVIVGDDDDDVCFALLLRGGRVSFVFLRKRNIDDEMMILLPLW
mmetsp:Transcript_49260/g.119399  ORF Transcript_49260/g.119399 Transcript_49260/m.119399 type:complete len:338 (-) Transcript_49260:57-1070(-)